MLANTRPGVGVTELTLGVLQGGGATADEAMARADDVSQDEPLEESFLKCCT